MKHGDAEQRAAIDRAFREESGLVLRWLTSKLGNKDDAQDVLQSVYLRALAFAEKNAIDNAKALIFRIAAHLAVDELRRRRRFRSNHNVEIDPGTDDPLFAVKSDTPSTEEALISRDELNLVMSALDKLPAKAKAAFLMNRVYGNTYSEIAESLGVSVSSVEKYMIKALVILRDVNRRRPRQALNSQSGAPKIQSVDFLSFAAGKRR